MIALNYYFLIIVTLAASGKSQCEQAGNGPSRRPAQGSKRVCDLKMRKNTIVKNLSNLQRRKYPETSKNTIFEETSFLSRKVSKGQRTPKLQKLNGLCKFFSCLKIVLNKRRKVGTRTHLKNPATKKPKTHEHK